MNEAARFLLWQTLDTEFAAALGNLGDVVFRHSDGRFEGGGFSCRVAAKVTVAQQPVMFALNARETGDRMELSSEIDRAGLPRHVTRTTVAVDPGNREEIAACVEPFARTSARGVASMLTRGKLDDVPRQLPSRADGGMKTETPSRLWSVLHGSFMNMVRGASRCTPELKSTHVHFHNGPFIYLTSSTLTVGDRSVVPSFFIQSAMWNLGQSAMGKIEVCGDIESEEGSSLQEIVRAVLDPSAIADIDDALVKGAAAFAAGCERATDLIFASLGLGEPLG